MPYIQLNIWILFRIKTSYINLNVKAKLKHTLDVKLYDLFADIFIYIYVEYVVSNIKYIYKYIVKL